MLYTCCPECRTTFRITEAILQKANGQVRCGRCAQIFDANAFLRGRTGAAADDRAGDAAADDRAGDAAADDRDEAASTEDTAADAAFAAVADEAFGPTRGADENENTSEAPGSGADVSSREGGADEGAIEAATENRVADEILEREIADALADRSERPAGTAQSSAPDWLPELTDLKPRSKLWSAGAAALIIVLAVQLAHHFRADLAAVPRLGSAVSAAYALLDVDVGPRFDLAQYDILESAAAAEPAAGQRGRLIIETRFRNDGPRVQPYPHLFVGLKDRWQETIAGRYFAPDEYLAAPFDDLSRMTVGRVVHAQLVLVDPGPDASGFEVDVCVRQPSGFACKEDAVFD